MNKNELFELSSNLGTDLKAMAGRDDKSIIFELCTVNETRALMHSALADAGVVTFTFAGGYYRSTLVI